jgi:hypothetical protein
MKAEIGCGMGYEEREDYLVDYADKSVHFEGRSYPEIRAELRAKIDELALQSNDNDGCAVMGDLIMYIKNNNCDHHFFKWLRRP